MHDNNGNICMPIEGKNSFDCQIRKRKVNGKYSAWVSTARSSERGMLYEINPLYVNQNGVPTVNLGYDEKYISEFDTQQGALDIYREYRKRNPRHDYKLSPAEFDIVDNIDNYSL